MEVICKYFLVSLPQSADSHDYFDAAKQERKWTLGEFKLPDFQVGTLDSLVQQSEEVAKIDTQLAGAVGKIVDIYHTAIESPSAADIKVKQGMTYIENFTWNSAKYRLDKSIKDLVEMINNEVMSLDNDVRVSLQNYRVAQSNFMAAERKKNGNLSTKSLHEIVNPDDLITESENLTSVLVAVPVNSDKEFHNSYETLAQLVVPRSAKLLATDEEYKLYSVSLFKKYEQDFINGCREKKWQPRTDFTYDEDALNDYQKQSDLAEKASRDLRYLVDTAYSEIVAGWFHIKAIRCYVESVLRYGLPPQFDCHLVKFVYGNLGNADKVKKEFVEKFGYLGGEAVSNKSNLHEYASLVDPDYEPFVIYQVDIAA